jgi:hypothetical protein
MIRLIGIWAAFGAAIMLTTLRAAAEPTDANNALLRLLDQYRLVRTLHVKTTTATDYKTIPPGIFHVDGTQEYWADGLKFRILQLMDSSMFPGMSHDVRWDGRQYQWFNVNDGTLIVSKKSKQGTPFIGEPIPLLPLEFLNPGGNDLGVKLSLMELCGDNVRSHCAEAHFAQSDLPKAIIPGGTVGDLDTIYRLEFGGSPSYLPTTIRRISSDGVELDTDEIKYRAVQCSAGVVYLPCWVRMTDRTTDNRVDSVTISTVTLMEADTAIPPETFTNDYQTVKRIIDIDRAPQHQAADSPTKGDSTASEDEAALDSNATLPATPAVYHEGPWTLEGVCTMLIGIGLLATGLKFLYRR